MEYLLGDNLFLVWDHLFKKLVLLSFFKYLQKSATSYKVMKNWKLECHLKH